MEMSSSRRYSAGGITHRSLNLVEPSVRELQPTHSKETPQQELKEEETALRKLLEKVKSENFRLNVKCNIEIEIINQQTK